MDNFLWVITLILGTITFAWVFFKCDIVCFGCGGIIVVWGLCVLVVGIVVGILGEVAGGLFSIIWFLIKAGIIIAIIGSIGMYIYNKVKGLGNKEN